MASELMDGSAIDNFVRALSSPNKNLFQQPQGFDLKVRTSGDYGEVDGEYDDEDEETGEEEQPMLSSELHA